MSRASTRARTSPEGRASETRMRCVLYPSDCRAHVTAGGPEDDAQVWLENVCSAARGFRLTWMPSSVATYSAPEVIARSRIRPAMECPAGDDPGDRLARPNVAPPSSERYRCVEPTHTTLALAGSMPNATSD